MSNNINTQVDLINQLNKTNSSLLMAIKDSSLRYIAITNELANLYGCTPSEIIGLTDSEFMSYEIKVFASYFELNDRAILQGNTLKIIHKHKVSNKVQSYLCTKKPILYDNTVGGIMMFLEVQYTENYIYINQQPIFAPFSIKNKYGEYQELDDLQLGICYYVGMNLSDKEIVTQLCNDCQFSDVYNPEDITYSKIKSSREKISLRVFRLESTAVISLQKELVIFKFSHCIPKIVYNKLFAPKVVQNL
jgi:hypothetical protein